MGRREHAPEDEETALEEVPAPIDSSSATDAREPTAPLLDGERYLIIETLKRGRPATEVGDETAVVLRAYDTRLQREVALKRVRTDALSGAARTRMLHAGRAMASLSHPNVVAVYDAEVDGDHVALAMEFVRGTTFERWLATTARTNEDVLATLICAGRGLAAAHATGLVHGNFKPSDILVGADGRVRVTDFGLGGLDETRSDGQVDAAVAGASDDQYAFCLILWEALTGHPAFLAGTVERREPPPWPRDVGLPRGVGESIRRGLAARPDERWPSMPALLDAIAYDPHRKRQVWLTAAATGCVVTITGGLWAAVVERRSEQCSGAPEQLEAAWGSERRQRVEQAMRATNVAYAADVWKHVEPQIDAYAATWIAMHRDTCEATTLRGEQPPEVMDLEMRCLRRAKIELLAVTDLLTRSDAQILERAHELVANLPTLSHCADPEALRSDVLPPDTADEQPVEKVRAALAEVRALREAGKLDLARDRAEALAERASQIDYPPLQTEALLELGYARERAGSYAEAEAALGAALRSALRSKQWSRAQAAASQLITTVGMSLGRPEAGLGHATTARALLTAADDEAQARVQQAMGKIFYAQGLYRDVEEEYRAALTAWERAFGGEHPRLAEARSDLATAFVAQGRYAEAETELRQALELQERTLGPHHPAVATSRYHLGRVLTRQGRYDEAEQEHRAALAVQREVLQPGHPDIAGSRCALGSLLLDQGRYVEAEQEYSASLAASLEVLGPRHPTIAATRLGLGNVLRVQGRHAEAVVQYRAGLALQEGVLGSRHPEVASLRNGLGNALLALKRFEEAEREFRAAISSWEQQLGLDHPNVAVTRNNLGGLLAAQGDYAAANREYNLALGGLARRFGEDHPHVAVLRHNMGAASRAQGHHEEAETHFRTALAALQKTLRPDHHQVLEVQQSLGSLLLERNEAKEALPLLEDVWRGRQGDASVPPGQRAEMAFSLARALASEPRQRTRARALARTARALYVEAAAPPGTIATVEAWLRDQL